MLDQILQRHIDLVDQINLAINGHGYAAVDKADLDIEKNTLYEGYFMRSFISFERCLEEIFVHFACGGQSLSGAMANCRLINCDPSTVRKILKQGNNFVDWANMEIVRERASTFFVDGKPFIDPLMGKSSDLSHLQKIRNRISHDSVESKVLYDVVLVDIFHTKPIFEMSPGQILRSRRKKSPIISMQSHYMGAMTDVLAAICEKP
ncbi:hypothetical protein V7S57_17830 [Caulobacter sp. CCNWLY153]|uniref:hypothetical protein n=1 Tax=unclassified Caulobacter TaxID=2648921 RepID=UPI002FF0ADED